MSKKARSVAMKESWKRRKAGGVIGERANTHGDFAQNAAISQDIKSLFRLYNYLTLAPVHVEALDMIALKLSRILSGHSGFKDHWADIAGYAKLGEQICD